MRKSSSYEKLDATDYLKDILQAIDEVETFIDDLSYEEFVKDRKTLNAVVRSIEKIREKSFRSYLISTHEPCPTCAAAIVWSGISSCLWILNQGSHKTGKKKNRF